MAKLRFRLRVTPKLTLAFALVAAISVLSVGVFAFLSGRNALRSAVATNVTSIAIEKTEALETWRQERRLEITEAARILGEFGVFEIPKRDSITSVARIPSDRLIMELDHVRGQNFISAFVMDIESGEVVASTDDIEVGKFKESRPYFLNGKQGPYVQNLYHSFLFNGPAITFSAPIESPDGELLGVLAGRGNLSDINDVITRSSGLYDSEDVFLVDRANLFATQPRFIEDPAVLKRGVRSEAVERCLTRDTGSLASDDYREVPSVTAYRWLTESQVCLIVKVDQSEAYAPIFTLRRNIFVFIALAFATAGAVGLGIAKTITRPIAALQSGVERFHRREAHVDISLTSHDELGDVSLAFNEMARERSQIDEELRRREFQLQQLVEDLTVTNQQLNQEMTQRQESEDQRRIVLAELEVKNRELENLAHTNQSMAEIGRVIGSSLDITEVYSRVAEQAREIIKFEHISVSLIDRVQEEIISTYSWGIEIPGNLPGDRVPLADTLVDQVARTSKGIFLGAETEDELSILCPSLSPAYTCGLRSFIAVPLIDRDVVIGVLQVRSTSTGAYSEIDLEVSERIGRQIAGAITNSLAFQEVKHAEDRLSVHNSRLAILAEIANILAIPTEQAQKFQQVLDQLVLVSGADWAVLRVPDELEGGLRMVAETVRSISSPQFIQPFAIGISGAAWRQGKTVVANDYQSHPDTELGAAAQGVKSMVALPVKSGDRTSAIASVISTSPNFFTPEVVDLLSSIVGGIGQFMESAELTYELSLANSRLEETLVELQRTQEQVAREERLRALGTMASGIAHDFNNALAPIVGYSDMLLNDPLILADSEKATGFLKRINTAATEATDVVNRMRGFYRPPEGTEVLSPVDLNSLAVQAVELTEPRWKDMAQSEGIDVSVETALDSDQPVVLGNESDLRTALTNLIINGLDAMPAGGTLTVSTRARETTVELSVSDTGVGMTDEVRRRAMEPFFTTKGDTGGSGLGLAMVHGIIERHEGQIDVQTELGQGTTFVIQLPQTNTKPEFVETAKVVEPTRELNVLLVEDDALVRMLFSQYLTTDGYTVETASNGKEALKKFKPNTFDLVITDRSMPEMNGDQLAAAIKEVEPDIPIIMLTGFGGVMDAVGERPVGVDSLLSKPITMAAMRQAIAQVLGERG